jgi:hypothetical protein
MNFTLTEGNLRVHCRRVKCAGVSSAPQPRACFQIHARHSTAPSNLAVRARTHRDVSSRTQDMRYTCFMFVMSKAEYRDHYKIQTSEIILLNPLPSLLL